jgi:hypothetical protein
MTVVAPVLLTRQERAWNWHTWNLLVQIQEATDGEDSRYKSGDMTVRGICSGQTPELRALLTRGWIEHIDTGEYQDGRGEVKVESVWAVTKRGRRALEAAVKEGVTVR